MSELFDRKLSLLLLILAIPLLFLPKINLVSIGSETAGLRVDDLVLFFAGMLIVWSFILSNQPFKKIEAWIIAITLFSLFSYFSNRLLVALEILHMDAKIFYVFRFLEYFIFFYIGFIASKYLSNVRVVVILFFGWNLLLMILQKMHLTGGITYAGYTSDVSERVQGIASFPSEMGLLLNLLFCYLLFDEAPYKFITGFKSPLSRFLLKSSFPYFLFVIFGIFIILTGNRISIIALLLSFFIKIRHDFNWRALGAIASFFILIPLLAFGTYNLIKANAGIYERSKGLFSFKNLALAEIVWDRIDLTIDPVGHEVVSAGDYDMSWWMRIHKWIHAIKAYCYNPVCYLQGLGPGFAWAALDGGLLRIWMENGLIGAALYWGFFRSIYKINPQTKAMTFAFIVNMIFFDAYLAYKTMSFFLFSAGSLYEKKEIQTQNE